MVFAQFIISPGQKVSLASDPLIISLKMMSCDTLVISRIYFRRHGCNLPANANY